MQRSNQNGNFLNMVPEERNGEDATSVNQLRNMSNVGSKLSNGRDDRRADSVLGDTSKEVLLKAVIQKSDYTAKRLEDVNDRLTAETKHNYREQDKTNGYLMGMTEELQTSIT